MLRNQFLETSRGRIAALLRHGGQTADEMASRLGVTANAIRAQLVGMERDGFVRRAGQRRGTTRPAQVFVLTSEVEQLLSGAYVPLVSHLVRVLSQRLRADHVRHIMRDTGKSLADALPVIRRSAMTLEGRVRAASDVMNEQLGAVTQIVRKNGGYVIRGAACPLAAISNKHPSICLVIESFVHEIVGVAVQECCDRDGRPRCCFEVDAKHFVVRTRN